MGEESDQEREKNAPRFSELGPPFFHVVRSPQSPFPSVPLTRPAECPTPQRARSRGWRPTIPERCPSCPRCGLGQAALSVFFGTSARPTSINRLIQSAESGGRRFRNPSNRPLPNSVEYGTKVGRDSQR